jgi:hypothetical protein
MLLEVHKKFLSSYEIHKMMLEVHKKFVRHLKEFIISSYKINKMLQEVKKFVKYSKKICKKFIRSS